MRTNRGSDAGSSGAVAMAPARRGLVYLPRLLRGRLGTVERRHRGTTSLKPLFDSRQGRVVLVAELYRVVDGARCGSFRQEATAGRGT